MGVEAFLAHHHAGDVGPPPAWGGIADDGPGSFLPSCMLLLA